VCSDMLGLFDEFVPPFVKQYAHLADTIVTAGQAYVDDVRAGRYPRAAQPSAVTRAT
jgi:3-methyl-2-oxobutanoate hydroxymethyltransferase